MRLTLVVLAPLFALLVARPAAAVEGGVEDRVTTHAVAIATGGPATPVLRCSGTLVAPNVVLTVRHCISLPTNEATTCEQTFGGPAGEPSDYWVNATPWTIASTSWRNVRAWVVPEPHEVCGNDIALLVLAAPYPEAEATPATPALAEKDVRAALAARAFGLAAFGATSATGAGGGTRRSRFDIPVACVPGDPSFDCAGALDHVDVREFSGGAGPCVGDSGGGALAATDHGVVFGVLSRGQVARGTCAEGVFERTDAWSWLLAKTVLEATPPGTTPPAWAKAAFPDAPRAGDRCLGAGTCAGDAECVSFDGRRSFVCAARCTGGCASGTHCESGVCAPDVPGSVPPGTREGCRAAPAGSFDFVALLALATGLLGRARASSARARAPAERSPCSPTKRGH